MQNNQVPWRVVRTASDSYCNLMSSIDSETQWIAHLNALLNGQPNLQNPNQQVNNIINQRIIAERRLTQHLARLPHVTGTLHLALDNFNRETTATIRGPSDTVALQMFRQWGGDPIRFKIAPWMPAYRTFPIERSLRQLFIDSGIPNIEPWTTYEMNADGGIILIQQ